MKVLKTTSGRIQLIATLNTMEVGDTWRLPLDTYKISTIRVGVSNYCRAVNKMFTVNNTDNRILITRNK